MQEAAGAAVIEQSLQRNQQDEMKTRCCSASTLCAPQIPLKLSRLGLLSLEFLGVLLLLPILLQPLELDL